MTSITDTFLQLGNLKRWILAVGKDDPEIMHCMKLASKNIRSEQKILHTRLAKRLGEDKVRHLNPFAVWEAVDGALKELEKQ